VLSVVLMCLICPIKTQAQASTGLELRDCRLESTTAPGSIAARCGYLQVPEDHDHSSGGVLSLHVTVIPAMRLSPAADPLFVLSGGPGQAASDFYLSIAPAFARIRRDRDLVLVDQRGTGRSHRLDCALDQDTGLTTTDRTALKRMTQECLRVVPGDVRFYTTSVAVRDLDEVRRALGHESINLYGVSYGTRVAQHYLRRYPAHVRAVILDGAVPASLALGPAVALEAQRVLDNILERCAADARCNAAFPDVAQGFSTLQSRLRARPVELTLPDPLTASPVSLRFGASELGAAVRLLSYTDETASVLPLLIHEAQAGYPQRLAAQYLMIHRRMDRQIAMGMHFAVVCSEDAPGWDDERVSQEALQRTYLGTDFMQAMRAVCEEWPPGIVDPDLGEPLRSTAPVLILSGTQDPITPERYGREVSLELPNARHLVLSGQGHGQLGIGCVPLLAARFIDQGSIEELDTSCADKIAAAPFMLSPTATAP